MSAILKFDFQKRKQLRFSEVNYLNTKRPNFACDYYIFPKTRGNKEHSVDPFHTPVLQAPVFWPQSRMMEVPLRATPGSHAARVTGRYNRLVIASSYIGYVGEGYSKGR